MKSLGVFPPSAAENDPTVNESEKSSEDKDVIQLELESRCTELTPYEEKYFFRKCAGVYTGKFNKKYSAVRNYPYFERALRAIYTILEFGNHKYSFYSWQNIPLQSDSSLEMSLDACNRHFINYRHGNILEDSGIDHLAHAVARSSMALTRFYRLITGDIQPRQVTREKVSGVISKMGFHNESPVLFRMDQITKETVVSMLKYDRDYVGSTILECLDIADECITRTAMGELPILDPMNGIFPMDVLFWNLSEILTYHPEIDDQLKVYLSKIE